MHEYHGKLAAAVTLSLLFAASGARAADGVTVIELTQTGCQFLEPENGVDLGHEPASAADCEAVNADSAAARLADARTLELTPGRYVFRVTNLDVSYPLGFYLRAASRLAIPFKPRVSGGGLTTGTTKDYEIELEEGEYVYSCPLNPTPDYALVVKG